MHPTLPPSTDGMTSTRTLTPHEYGILADFATRPVDERHRILADVLRRIARCILQDERAVMCRPAPLYVFHN